MLGTETNLPLSFIHLCFYFCYAFPIRVLFYTFYDLSLEKLDQWQEDVLFSFYFLYSAASINKSSRHQFAIFSVECLFYVGSWMFLLFSYRLYRTACTMDHTRRCHLLWIYLIFSHETKLLPELLVAEPAIWYLSSRFLVCLHSLVCCGRNTWCLRACFCVYKKSIWMNINNKLSQRSLLWFEYIWQLTSLGVLYTRLSQNLLRQFIYSW